MGLWSLVNNLAIQSKHICGLDSACEPPTGGPQDEKKEEKKCFSDGGKRSMTKESKEQEGLVGEGEGSPQNPGCHCKQ